MKKPDKALLARVDARNVTREIEQGTEDFEYFRDWRNQIKYYRDQLAKLPDQCRFDQESGRELPAGRIEGMIDHAEEAAKADDLGRYGLHIAETVRLLLNQQLPTIEKAVKRAAASRSASHERPSRQGTLRKIIKAINAQTTAQAEQAFKDGAKIEIDGQQFALSYHPEDDKPFQCNGERWNRGNIANKVSTTKAKK